MCLVFCYFICAVSDPSEVQSKPKSVESDEPNSNYVLIDGLDFENFPTVFDVKKHYMFHTKEYLGKVMHLIAIRNNFQFKVKRSTLRRYSLVCVKDKCCWKLNAASGKESTFWVITSYDKEHSCELDIVSNDHKQASSFLVAECIKRKLRMEGCENKSCPKDIVNWMCEQYGVKISYYKGWRARQKALDSIRGTAEESYALIPVIGEALKDKNTGICVCSCLLNDLYFC